MSDFVKDFADALRILSMDAVEKARSGHPGMPMGAADFFSVLVNRHLLFSSRHPKWPNRDRVVLSAGHGSMLLYAMLHLTGYADFSLEEIKKFRQAHSKTPGHPEFGHGAGIETTTGPLGQGLATAVGMAIAEKALHQRYPELFSHYTYVIAGDGCLMEGISHEAFSLAGHLKLHKLIVLFDDNGISIDGATHLSCRDNVALRMQAYGWEYIRCDGHHYEEIDRALHQAKSSAVPTLIACKTTIGYGAPNKQGTAQTHGSPLGKEEIQAARKYLHWKDETPFSLPETLVEKAKTLGQKHSHLAEEWDARYKAHTHRQDIDLYLKKNLPADLETDIRAYKKQCITEAPVLAPRAANQKILGFLSERLPQLMGGSADLTPSNLTRAPKQQVFSHQNPSGTYIHYGIREFAMAAAMNGLALHEGFIPYGGTFLVFSDYCRSAIRLSALMRQRVIYIFTHDSIGVGEDGPTHQPIEHLSALRAIPDTQLLRPCDIVECLECWDIALHTRDKPSLFALSKQNLPTFRTAYTDDNLSQKGAYILETFIGADPTLPILHLWASGSEVALARAVAQQLHQKTRYHIRLISTPSLQLFYQSDKKYREKLYEADAHFIIEAGTGTDWTTIYLNKGLFFGTHQFGISAPAEKVYQHFGLTEEHITQKILHFLSEKKYLCLH